MRKPELVVNEIEHYINRYEARNIDFMDLTAFTRKSWIMEFCKEIQDRSLNFTWQLPSGTRVEQMDEGCLAAMAATGCMNLTLAPESGSERTLKEIKKKVKLSKIYETIRYAKQQKIFVKCNLIIGFPTERRRDIWQTLWTSLRFSFMGVDDMGLNLFSPYPGSELFSYLQTTGKIKKIDHSYFEDLMVFQNIRRSSYFCENIGSRELSFYRLVGLCSFYGFGYLLRPSRILRTIRNYRADRSDTVFEERLFALFHRRQIEKVTLRREIVTSSPSSLATEVPGRRDSLPSGAAEPVAELVVAAEPMVVAERESVTPVALNRP
jgi:radical SAM superfamily enzyme YgiQ (UPF0313 family)